MRTLLDFQIRPNEASVGYVLAMGLVVADAASIAGATTAQPEIETDQPGWLWRAQKFVEASTVGESQQFTTVKEDIKSMRKFAGNEVDYNFVVNNPSSASVIIIGIIRTLVKLP